MSKEGTILCQKLFFMALALGMCNRFMIKNRVGFVT